MFWWARFLFFSAVAVFFLEFGVEEMIRAYQTRKPYDFLGSFFEASFIILISGTLLVAFVWRMILRAKEKPEEKGKGENGGKGVEIIIFPFCPVSLLPLFYFPYFAFFNAPVAASLG